jgi:hypothetical protein
MAGELLSLRDELLRLRRHALNVEHTGEDEVALVDPARRSAARNLVDYLAVPDNRPIPRRLRRRTGGRSRLNHVIRCRRHSAGHSREIIAADLRAPLHPGSR